MRARRSRWAAVLLTGATGMSGVGSVLWLTALPAAAFTAPVNISNQTYSPKSTTIEIGDRVLWRNKEEAKDGAKDEDLKHTVTSDSGSERFDYTLGTPGATAERRFDKAGTYTYHCRFHPKMNGTIEVVDPSAPPTTDTTAPAPPPTAPPATTTTTAPAPTSTTATTEPPTTTTTLSRPPAGVPPPPVAASAPAPPPTMASSSTTTVPSSTSTTVPPTTATSEPPPLAGDAGAAPGPAAESTSSTGTAPAPDTGDAIPTAAGPASASGDGVDPATVTLVSLLVAVGLFGAWTLIRVRPGRI